MPRPRNPKSALEKAHDAERMKAKFTKIAYTAKREEAEAFAAYCARRGQTVHSTLRAFVLECLAQDAPRAATTTPAEQNNTPEGK